MVVVWGGVQGLLALWPVVGAGALVVRMGRRGPLAQGWGRARGTGDAYEVRAGVGEAGAVVYQTGGFPYRGTNLRVLIVGAQIGRPGSASARVATRACTRMSASQGNGS